jgi:hypothetical protein
MADKKITELVQITTIASGDVLPIVDISDNTTKKIDITQIKAQSPVQSVNSNIGAVVLTKTDIGLSNVDNTSDANKPVSTATQTALDGKVDENAAITGATKTKITYDAKGLVTVGADATTADIADSTNKRYVTDAQATVIGNTSGTNTGDNATNSQYSGLAASKQDALTLTTTGTSGAATLVGATLNIPQYSGGGGTTWGSITGTLSTQTDLQTALNLKVPYTGATSDVNLGEFGVQLGNIEFDTTPTNVPTTAGSLNWNDTDGTLDLKLKGGNVTLQIGQEQVVRVVNKTATSINLLEANYQAVRITGAVGQRTKVDLAQATNDVLSAETIGLVTETINNNQEGFITTSGLVRGINTTGSIQGETWADGDILYLSPTTAGSVTKVKPTAPNHLIVIGYVIYAHITQGIIFVKVDNGYELDELHNVKITTAANNNVLAYTSATDIWENKTVETALGFTPVVANSAITGATKTKITYDAKGLVTAGADATTADIADSTNKRYVTDAQSTVIGNTSGTNSGNQTLANTSDATSHTTTLSATGGSVKLVEGSGITLTTTGTSADGIITIASTGGGSGTVTNVSALTLGTTGSDLSSTVANSTTTPVITLNVPNASAANRGALTSTDWSTFNGKQAALVSGTNIKTVNSTSLLGSGDVAVQATLVSGTNIKTINSTSILGSGNLVVAAAPSGISGAIQFSDGTSLSSDAANFFYDNTNDRLGLGINAPTSRLHIKGSGATSATSSFKIQNSANTELLNITDDGAATFGNRIDVNQPNISISSIATAITNGSFIGANLTGTKIGLLVGTNQSGYSYIQGRYASGAEHIRIQEYGSGISVGSATGDGYIGIGRTSQLASSKLGISVAPTASANYGLVSLGSGAFDGATAGFFTGSANGTLIAGNLASGGTSDLLNMQVAGVGRFKISSAGKPTYDSTITPSGTTGNQTINKPSGTVNIAAAGTTVTVTNSLVSTSSIVIAVVRTNDTTAYIKNVVSGTGSFDINLGAAATAEVSIGFIVNN